MTAKTALSLSEDARAIWQAGVDAVRPDRLIHSVIQRDGSRVSICGQTILLDDVGTLVVVGAGKAGAGMAIAVEEALGPDLVDERVIGWVNVPADCVQSTRRIHLHAGRPASVNEPTEAGVRGSEEILKLVAGMRANDVCLVLISGGGSALLPAPIPPITLADKQATTRFLMQSGADILALNTVRKRLSRIKGGGLARACRAGPMIALIISDIVGDPLDMIASGPTVEDSSTDEQALAVLEQFGAKPPEVPQRVFDYLHSRLASGDSDVAVAHSVQNHVIGNNAVALEAASREACSRGYEVTSLGSDNAGEANDEGRKLARQCRQIRDDHAKGPVCLLSGGEPVVHLTKQSPIGKGGRNQQLVLSALQHLLADGMHGISLLSGGTDGEDGPTDAAGAWADEALVQRVSRSNVDIATYLDHNNAYAFFQQHGGLLKTGPTHTNVMDLRVAIINGSAEG